MNKPLQVGVTGGIGSGKSLVCSIFSILKAPVYDADSRARWLMNNNKSLVDEIIQTFGSKSYNTDGMLDRNYLASKVFKHEPELKKLNGLVHPAVGSDYQRWVKQHESHPYVIKEAALMFESGSYKALDYIINVSASEATRITRVLQRDTFRKKEELEAIIDRQLSEKERRKRADFIIENDENAMILPQILALHNRFKAIKKATC
ncbi:dephospho-CoA kinase [Fulvivirga sp. M361]|uniref:dephospho-CoA kinase n=1 Tax=Fulvivirga sp. M361 TaxID=2594266 RepID=UPI00117BA918|nr:dephospho-CoA kinase [Fulvivirga sp. M361]TRX48905.1 dephospho-CoA kinase [Fulvivirga sp. M361]